MSNVPHMFEYLGASVSERDRRWRNIRSAMAQNGLDALIVVGAANVEHRGFVRYVSNIRTSTRWSFIVFPLDGEPVSVGLMGGGWIKNRKEISGPASQQECGPFALATVNAIKDLKLENSVLGIEGWEIGILPAIAFEIFCKELPKATFKPSRIIEECRMIKSQEELRYVEMTANAVDKAYEAFVEAAKPGKRECEVYGEVMRTLISEGCEEVFLGASQVSSRVLNPGDTFVFYPETQGPGGYWLHYGRVIALGEPRKEMREMYEVCIKVQNQLVTQLKPGKTALDVMEAINYALKGTKFTSFRRVEGTLWGRAGHAMGLDVVEKPWVDPADNTIYKPGMVIGIHPLISSPDMILGPAFADTFLITENEPQKLTRSPTELKIV